MNIATGYAAVFFMCCAAAQVPAQVLAQDAPTPNRPDAGDAARAIDRKLSELTIASKELPEVLAEIGERVGITIELDERSADLLPWGRRTKLESVSITDASLREVLPQILGRLGMTYELRGARVVAVAMEPLKRINRRATWDELALLWKCMQTEYTPEVFAAFKIHYRITRKVDAPALLRQQLERAGRGTVAEMLEVATGSLGWVWFPYEDHIRIRTAQAQIANQLARRITVRYEDTPLSRILTDLADRAEVALLLEPGMMLKLPPAVTRSSLVLQHTSIRQALNLISAETGLKYEMRRDGLYVGLADDLQTDGARATARRSPYVGKITVASEDGSYTFDVLLREDELPADILEYRRQIIDEYISRIRRDMAPDSAAPGAGGQS